MKRTLGGMIISLSDSEAALTLPSPQRDNISQCEIGSAEIAYEACILRFIVAGTNTNFLGTWSQTNLSQDNAVSMVNDKFDGVTNFVQVNTEIR